MDTETLEVTTNVETVKFYGERLGTVQEVTEMLQDLDAAYNSIARFSLIVDSVVNNNKDQLLDLFLMQDSVDSLGFPGLEISAIRFGSPGFWEVLGLLNPLETIRKYLQDIHEREKDDYYKTAQEKTLGELAIIEKRDQVIANQMNLLRTAGIGEEHIQQFVITMIQIPLGRLGEHQDKGLISSGGFGSITSVADPSVLDTIEPVRERRKQEELEEQKGRAKLIIKKRSKPENDTENDSAEKT